MQMGRVKPPLFLSKKKSRSFFARKNSTVLAVARSILRQSHRAQHTPLSGAPGAPTPNEREMPCGEREMPGNEREMTPPGVGGEHSFRRLQPTVSTDLRWSPLSHLASALLASAKTAHTAQMPKRDA